MPNRFDEIANELPIARNPAAVRRRIEAMEQLLERAFAIPGTSRRVGLDSVLGLIPVVGDLVTGAMGAWIIWEARNLGVGKFQLARMIANLGVDTAVGAIPIVGEVFDFAFRSNTRNLRILKRWLDKHHPETGIIEGEVVVRRELLDR